MFHLLESKSLKKIYLCVYMYCIALHAALLVKVVGKMFQVSNLIQFSADLAWIYGNKNYSGFSWFAYRNWWI